MAEVAALFKQFLYRDLAFILGGSIVLLSLAYAFRGCIPSHWLGYWEEFQPASTVLIAAAAYVVGYAVQDVGGVLRLTSTGHFQPKRRREWLYKRFSRKEWRSINYVAENDREFKFDIHLGCLEIPERVIQELERIRSLKVISMCVGGCLLVSALIFLLLLVFDHSSSVTALAWLQSIAVPCRAPWVPRDWVILTVSAVLAACLICLGWIKGMQEMQFYQSIYEGFPEKQTGTIKWGATLFTINTG